MKTRVAFDGPEVHIYKVVEREDIPDVDDFIRVQDPADGAIYNGYVVSRAFDDEGCALIVEQA